MKIYTKTGDQGKTSLATGQRVAKSCDRLESYGTIDELNTHIGMLIALDKDPCDQQFLTTIQGRLFTIGAYLATDSEDIPPTRLVNPQDITELETEIDRMADVLPPLKAFILPQGSVASCQAGICRTTCRRAERCIIRLTESGINIHPGLLQYINRLSDYFFQLSRKINQDEKKPDTIWK
ncbi:MAG: cob(I)yrinic acid a,c-diamide adenosyltransferase [Bacteroidaceae bacterium]|nr:cob(I)yrinic acid a,c-diamide adenosyltransferase [Bacteroidaceae bacterium]